MPVIRALGTSVQVDLGDAVDADEFATAWSRCLVDGVGSTTMRVGARTTMTSLTQAITQRLIERRRGELLMLHAGAVCNPTSGASLAYAAPGGTGKTTLTRLLGQHYGYLTDETVGVEPGSWRIHPYEKPLSVRNGRGGHPKQEHSPDDLSLVRAHPVPRLTTLALLRRVDHRPDASVTRLDLFDAIPLLAPETSSLASLTRPLQLLANLEEAIGGFWLVEYAEAEQVQDWARDRLGDG